MRFGLFSLFDVLGGIAWAAVMGILGYVFKKESAIVGSLIAKDWDWAGPPSSYSWHCDLDCPPTDPERKPAAARYRKRSSSDWDWLVYSNLQ